MWNRFQWQATLRISFVPSSTLKNGTYPFAVDAGYVQDGKFFALSDKVQVVFDIPDDYRKFQQNQCQLRNLADDIPGTVHGEEGNLARSMTLTGFLPASTRTRL